MGFAALGQPYTSRLGRFQVDQKKGCLPLTITLTNLLVGDCSPGKPCVMDYEGNNTQLQNQFTHTYTTVGTFKLSVIYQSIGADDITITVDPNPQPNFEIYACAASQASIRVVDNNYDQYVINFNSDQDNVPEFTLPFSNNISTPSYTYVPAGTHVASVRGRRLNSADNCTAKTQSFTTLAVLPTPALNTLTALDATSVKLDFTAAANISYRLEIAVNNSTTYQLLQSVYGINTVTLTGLKLDNNFYCFRLGAFDPCNNVTTYSNQVCTSLITATAQSDVNKIAWSTGAIPFVSSYSLNVKQANVSTSIPINNPSANAYNDANIVCRLNYCYQLTTNYGGGAKSISLEKCVTSFSNKTPTGITDVTSIVGAAGVELSWTQDPKFTPINYGVQRAAGTAPLAFFTVATTPKTTDGSYTTEGKFCYQIGYTDKCGNIAAAGSQACPIRLEGTLDKKNAIGLTWSSYHGWKNGVKNYVVQKYNLQGALIKTFTVTDTTFLDDLPDVANQLVRYSIEAVANDPGLIASVSNALEFIKNANLYHPDAFTPNGDNLNDGFTVRGQFIVKMSLKIYDRWGALLFATEKNEPWDGRSEGKAMPPSTYIWKAEITDLAGRTFAEHGTVALLRN
jgi:gliding motility-associated-like protein